MACNENCRRPRPASAESHCSAEGCHVSFGGPSFFDRHRRDGECLDPADIGLIEQDGVWTTAEGHAHRAVLAERMAKARNNKGKSKK
jgi:hypothetical protein